MEPPREIHVKMVQANIDTLEKMLNYVAKMYTNKKCLGTREILSEEDEVQPNGRIFKKYKMGEYKWRTFNEVESAAANFGRGLRELGSGAYKNIVIFAETRAEWMIAAHGCFKQNFPIVTIYATLGDEGVIHGTYIHEIIFFTIFVLINNEQILRNHVAKEKKRVLNPIFDEYVVTFQESMKRKQQLLSQAMI